MCLSIHILRNCLLELEEMSRKITLPVVLEVFKNQNLETTMEELNLPDLL